VVVGHGKVGNGFPLTGAAGTTRPIEALFGSRERVAAVILAVAVATVVKAVRSSLPPLSVCIAAQEEQSDGQWSRKYLPPMVPPNVRLLFWILAIPFDVLRHQLLIGSRDGNGVECDLVCCGERPDLD
jgi:hypothetical protein